MSEDVEKLKSRISELEGQLVEEKEELEWDLKAVKESSDKTVKKLQDEIAKMKKEGGASAPAGGAKSDDVKMLTQRALMAERRVAELQEDLKRSRNLTPAPVSKGSDPLQRQRAESAEGERDELRKEKRALERNLEEKKNSLQRTKKELEEAKKLKKQLEDLKKESTAQEKELRQRKEGAGDTSKLHEEISDLKARLADKEDDWGKLSANTEQSERELAQLRDQVEKLNKVSEERDQLAARNQEGLEKIGRLEASLQKLQAQAEDGASAKETELNERASEAEREVIRLKQELAQVKVASGQMVEQREREAERLKSDLEDVSVLAEEKTALERESNQLREDLAVTSGARDELAAQLRLLRDDHETQVRPAPVEPDPFIVATQPAGNPRGAAQSQQSDFPPEAELEDAEGDDLYTDQETKQVRFTDGVTEQTDALPSPLEGAPEEGDLPPPAVDSIDDERIPTQVSEPQETGLPEETDTKETSAVHQSRASDSQPPMAESVKIGKKRSRGGLLIKAAFFGILGGLLIASAMYFIPIWYGPGDEPDTDGTEPVAGSDNSDPDTAEQPPDGKQPDTAEVPPDQPDPPKVADDPPPDTPEPTTDTVAKLTPELKKAQAFGLGLLKKKKYKKAISFTKGWTEKVPNDPTMRYLYGRALFYRRKVEEAASELERAVKLDPDMHEAYYELGGVYMKLGQSAHACACLKTFVKLRPKDRRSRGVQGVLRKLKCSK